MTAWGQGRGTEGDGATISVKPIRIFGDPVLRTPADPVTDFDAELRRLVKDLTDTMLDAPGVGLAAPQIGVSLRVFTYHVDDQLGHLINPSLDLSPEEETDDEGCLSFPASPSPPSVPTAWWPRASTCTGNRSPWRAAATWRGAFSTRRITWTACCSSTGSTRSTRKLAMKEIREAEWWGEPSPAGQDLAAPHVGQGVLRCG
mgnify:CR=1 FL=1